MGLEITVAHNNYRLQGSLDYLSVGAGVALIDLYTAPQPATGAAPTGVYLGSVPLNVPPGSVTGNQLVLSVLDTGTAVAGGTAGWCRIRNRNGDVWADSNVSGVGGGAPVQLDFLSVPDGGTLSVASAVFT